jgi:hypothetical protein
MMPWVQMPIPIILPEIDELFHRQVRLAKKSRFPRQYRRHVFPRLRVGLTLA